MKKMIKEYITNNKKLKEIYEKEKEAQEKRQHNYYIIDEMKQQGKTSEEIKSYFLQNQEKEAEEKQAILQLQDKKKIYNIKENIIYNNIIISIYNKYKDDINNIMLKYENKNIGEKTKEKIQNEIKDLLKNDDNFKNDDIFIYVKNDYNSYNRYYLSIHIEISKKENYPDGGYRFIYQYKLSINYGKYTNVYENIENKKYIDVMAIYSYNDEKVLFSSMFDEIEKNNNYKIIPEAEKEAKNIIKLNNNNKIKFESLQEKLKEVKKQNDAAISQLKLSYANDEIYKIKGNINLY